MNTSKKTLENTTIDIKRLVHKLFRYWYLYLSSLLICFLLTWFYLKYTPPVYSIQTTLLIKEDKSKIGVEDFIDGLELLSSAKNVQNEIEVIRSYENVKRTIQGLNMDVSYFIEGNISTGELYNSSPFIVRQDTSFLQTKGTKFYIRILSDSTFSIHLGNENKKADLFNKKDEICRFGEQCKSKYFSLIINKSGAFSKRNPVTEYYFIINDIDKLVKTYMSQLKIELATKNSSIVQISLQSLIPKKGIDFLDRLCSEYLQTGLDEKNQIAVNTIRFIDAQLNEIIDSLQGAEKHLEKFRSSEKMMDLSSSAENAFSQLEILEKEQAELLVKNRYYNYLLDYVSYNYDIKKIIAPSAMGIQDPLLNNLIAELHTLNSEKTSLSFSTRDQNPTSHILDLKLENTKKSLIENLKNIIEASKIALQDNKNRLARIEGLINRLPANERSLVNIQRKFLLNETIYNYLMQKRIEAGIAKAANLADHKIINKALLYGNNPVSPKKPLILTISLLIGLLIPSAYIYIKTFLDDTVTSKDIIEHYTDAPIIGSIAHNKNDSLLPTLDSPKSAVSESIRSLRINLQYLAADKKNKVIGITSSVSGEGKTFFSANLASSIAMSGVKVIIIGADLRKPKLHGIFGFDNSKTGLSSYLIDKSSIQDIIIPTAIPHLDFIPAGPIPPNPTELLESSKSDELFTYLKENYEYIIIDAPPVGLVADYFLLSKHIDADLYLIRQNHTRKDLLAELNLLYKNKKLKNLFIVFNDVKANSGYGYGYQYNYGYHGYYEENSKESLLTIFKNFFFKKKI